LVVGCWLLVVGCWLLVVGCQSLVVSPYQMNNLPRPPNQGVSCMQQSTFGMRQRTWLDSGGVQINSTEHKTSANSVPWLAEHGLETKDTIIKRTTNTWLEESGPANGQSYYPKEHGPAHKVTLRGSMSQPITSFGIARSMAQPTKSFGIMRSMAQPEKCYHVRSMAQPTASFSIARSMVQLAKTH
jgi:hypothetical protein